MYFDRILFSALFATLLGTAVLAVSDNVTAGQTAAVAQPATIVSLPSLDRVVVTGQREAAPRS